MLSRAHIIYHGRVQGVFFRANCRKNALLLGLRGWVRNLPDGSVESMVEGAKGSIDTHIGYNRTGQPMAVVFNVDVDWGPATGEFVDFRVLG